MSLQHGHHEKFQRSEFRHNPYIGTFQRTAGVQPDINRHNPYIGYVARHTDKHQDKPSVDDKPFRRNFISNIQISQQSRPVNMLALKNLPLSFFTPPTISTEETPVCAICLEAFTDGDELRKLNCSHCFHRACVDIWLLGTLSDDIQLNGTCPTCRRHANSSPGRQKGHLTVGTNFQSEDANMSDLSVPSSTVTTSSADNSRISFDLLSPMSPDWSRDDIFNREEEENCLVIGQYLLDGPEDEIVTIYGSDDDISIESLEYSDCHSSVCIPSSRANTIDACGPIRACDLDDILDDEPSIIEVIHKPSLAKCAAINAANIAATATFGATSIAASATSAQHLSIDDCDVISVFSASQYSDCGFPLSSPQASVTIKPNPKGKGE